MPLTDTDIKKIDTLFVKNFAVIWDKHLEPNMATKAELKELVTKAELKAELKKLATKAELKKLATEKGLARLATKEGLVEMATKRDLQGLATNKNLQDARDYIVRVTNEKAGESIVRDRKLDEKGNGTVEILGNKKLFSPEEAARIKDISPFPSLPQA